MSKWKTETKLVLFRLYYKIIIKPNNLQTSCYLYTAKGRDDFASGNNEVRLRVATQDKRDDRKYRR